jgi:phosphoglycolate phosphatase-like HAD superfamily hydrolase
LKYKAIIFDFDDTLIISGEIKFNAFFKVFSSFLIEKKIIENILKEFPELNRYDTISKIIKQSKLDINNTLISDMYSDLVKKEILNANSLEFTEIILDKLFQLKIEIYLSSNTPEVLLTDIIKEKGWDKYFIKIFGYPSNKIDSLSNIIKSTGYNLDSYLVVGDGLSDKLSALKNNVDYFQVKSKSLKDLFLYLNL